MQENFFVSVQISSVFFIDLNLKMGVMLYSKWAGGGVSCKPEVLLFLFCRDAWLQLLEKDFPHVSLCIALNETRAHVFL